jgi:hypothetical protein
MWINPHNYDVTNSDERKVKAAAIAMQGGAVCVAACAAAPPIDMTGTVNSTHHQHHRCPLILSIDLQV